MRVARLIACLFLGALAAVASDASMARGRGGHPHHFHHGGAVFVGSTFWAPWPPPPPYYYGPDYIPRYELPSVYVERFDGTPPADTPLGEIFCPDVGDYYPDVRDCPGGWQRVFRPRG